MIKTYEQPSPEERNSQVVTVDRVEIGYTQEPDCVSDRDAFQEIKVWTENNGLARFICFKTERWAISDIDDMIELLKDFKERAGIVKDVNNSNEDN